MSLKQSLSIFAGIGVLLLAFQNCSKGGMQLNSTVSNTNAADTVSILPTLVGNAPSLDGNNANSNTQCSLSLSGSSAATNSPVLLQIQGRNLPDQPTLFLVYAGHDYLLMPNPSQGPAAVALDILGANSLSFSLVLSSFIQGAGIYKVAIKLLDPTQSGPVCVSNEVSLSL